MLSNPEVLRESMRLAANPVRRPIEPCHINMPPGVVTAYVDAHPSSPSPLPCEHDWPLAVQALMREHMRNTDRAVSNIESHPEGFNALRRMYENIEVRSSRREVAQTKHYHLLICDSSGRHPCCSYLVGAVWRWGAKLLLSQAALIAGAPPQCCSSGDNTHSRRRGCQSLRLSVWQPGWLRDGCRATHVGCSQRSSHISISSAQHKSAAQPLGAPGCIWPPCSKCALRAMLVAVIS